jgi:hypothetical protein
VDLGIPAELEAAGPVTLLRRFRCCARSVASTLATSLLA